MCGIAGVLYKENGHDREIGQALITMLDGCQHRGPDSTGFALYHEIRDDDELRLRFLVAEGEEGDRTIADIKARLAEFEAAVTEEERIGNTVRFTVRFDGDLQSLAYAMEHVAKVVSIGQSLDIVKDVGGAHDVDDTYHVAELRRHARASATSASPPSPTSRRTARIRSGPRASPTWRSSITARSPTTGRCAGASRSAATSSTRTTTRSSSRSTSPTSWPTARRSRRPSATSIDDLDGTFSFLVSTKDEIGYAKDRLAAKPMVMYEDDDLVAIASEEVSLNKLFPGRALQTIEPPPGTFRTWRRSI